MKGKARPRRDRRKVVITDPRVEEYLAELPYETDPIFEEMELLASVMGFPIVGPQIGRLLDLMVRISGARTVFEMGSGFGYSTLWIAQALPENGKVFWTDTSTENQARAQRFFDKAGLEDRVAFGVGDSLEIYKRFPSKIDLIFIDIEKRQYPDAWKMIEKRMEQNQVLIVDNTLWFGKVVEEEEEDPDTTGIRTLNESVAKDSRFRSTILPVRDGVLVAQRLPDSLCVL